MVVRTIKPISADDLVAMPDEDRFELVHGVLVERDMSPLSSRIGLKIARKLDEFCDHYPDAVVFGDNTGYTLHADDDDVVRKPDVSVVLKSRLPDGKVPTTRFRFSPDVAIEVISPSDTLIDVENKIQDYLDAGTQLVWVVNPVRKSVKVYKPDLSETVVVRDGIITAEPVLPGFQMRLKDIFDE